MFDKELSDKQKLLFCYISSLCAEKWFCRASNKYIAECLWCTWKTVSVNVCSLEKSWYIEVEISKDNGNSRKISISKWRDSVEKKKDSYVQKCVDPYGEKKGDPYIQKSPHNSISNNITNINNTNEDTSTTVEAKAVYGDPEINEAIEIIKKYNSGICWDSQKEQRIYSKNLIWKLKNVDTVVAGKFSWQQVLESVLKIISENQYHSHKIGSPKKIYFGLAELMQICKQSVNKPPVVVSFPADSRSFSKK